MLAVQQLGRHVDDGAACSAVVASLVDAAARDATNTIVCQDEPAAGQPQHDVVGLEVHVDDVCSCEGDKAGRELERGTRDDVGWARRHLEAPTRQQLHDDEVRRAGREAWNQGPKVRNRADTVHVDEVAPAAQVVRLAAASCHIAMFALL